MCAVMSFSAIAGRNDRSGAGKVGGPVKSAWWFGIGRSWAPALVLVAAATLPVHAANDAPNTVSETYQDWIVRCTTVAGAAGAPAARTCEMVQDIRKREGGERVLAVLIGYKTGEKPKLTLLAPLGLALPQGIKLSLDAEQKPLVDLSFATCVAAGCIATAEFTPALSARLDTGTSIRVGLTAYEGKATEVPVSLRGFAAARKRLGELQAR